MFESHETIDRIFINSDSKIALTDKEGGVRLYCMEDDNDEPSILTSYHDHKGPVMDIAFSPLTHAFYILACSYDRSVSLRTREAQVFYYKEDDTTIGFFVSCCIVKTEGEVLRFLVGSSTGYVLDFDSRNGFIPIKHSLFSESIVGLGSTDDNCILICANNNAPRIYTDRSFADFITVASESQNEKFKFAKFSGDSHEANLLLVAENGLVEIFRLTREDNILAKEASFQFQQKILAVSWNFSRHSANIIIFNNENTNFQTSIIEENLSNPGNWNIVDTSIEVGE